jgi:hypothetical protein
MSRLLLGWWVNVPLTRQKAEWLPGAVRKREMRRRKEEIDVYFSLDEPLSGGFAPIQSSS